jgi:hypothetical protein
LELSNAMLTQPTPEIDVIAFETSDGIWIAQGVQYDIVARAKSAIALRVLFAGRYLPIWN